MCTFNLCVVDVAAVVFTLYNFKLVDGISFSSLYRMSTLSKSNHFTLSPWLFTNEPKCAISVVLLNYSYCELVTNVA